MSWYPAGMVPAGSKNVEHNYVTSMQAQVGSAPRQDAGAGPYNDAKPGNDDTSIDVRNLGDQLFHLFLDTLESITVGVHCGRKMSEIGCR